MSTSVFASEQLLKWLFTGDTLGTRPTSWYVSLHTGDPTADGSANEVTDANYARQSATFTAAAFKGSSVYCLYVHQTPRIFNALLEAPPELQQ